MVSATPWILEPVSLDRRTELGEFLRSRRARLSPEEVGLPDYGSRRRVPGLRREELAMVAGVSVDHYVRLEQGRTLHFSESVLDAVAQALRLNQVEREHLYRLARPWSGEEPSAERRARLHRGTRDECARLELAGRRPHHRLRRARAP
jgi:transcriptional regulator with XRE-family HTH domain